MPDFVAWARAAHVWPLTVVVCLTVLLGLAAGVEKVDVVRLLLLVVAILGNQLCIGWSNDYLDRDADRRYQPSKPIASGRIRPRSVAAGAAVAFATSVAAGLLLGPVALVLLLGGTVAGLAYNLGVKDTRLSWLPYILAFALLPPFAWQALDAFRTDLLWLYPVALPLAGVAHLANALPDLAADTAGGSNGTVVRLGRQRTLVLVAAGLALPPLLLALSMPFLPFDAIVLGPVFAGYAFAVLLTAICYRDHRDGPAFRWISVAALVFVAGSVAAL